MDGINNLVLHIDEFGIFSAAVYHVTGLTPIPLSGTAVDLFAAIGSSHSLETLRLYRNHSFGILPVRSRDVNRLLCDALVASDMRQLVMIGISSEIDFVKVIAAVARSRCITSLKFVQCHLGSGCGAALQELIAAGRITQLNCSLSSMPEHETRKLVPFISRLVTFSAPRSSATVDDEILQTLFIAGPMVSLTLPHRTDPHSSWATIDRMRLVNLTLRYLCGVRMSAEAAADFASHYRVPHIRAVVRLRVMCQAGRASASGSHSEIPAWLAERAPLWVVVHVVALLRE